MDWNLLDSKKRELDALRPLPPELVANLNEWFRVELTYTSNAIEGNTLSRRETAVVLDKGITVGGKGLKDHLEAINHAHAFDFVHQMINQHHEQIAERDVLKVHELILKGLDDSNAGCYRNVAVRIAGSTVVLPNYRKVPQLMEDFVDWLQKADLHPAALASEAHYRLVTIHPFVDGNGRTARLLMNLILMRHGYPPAIVRLADRLKYLESLETAQLGGSKAPYEALIFNAASRSLDIYLNALLGGDSKIQDDRVSKRNLKIGQLANAAGVTVPTIRFWTKEGLLDVAEVTPSGYQIYSPEMIDRCSRIQKLKKKRMTLAEIKQVIRTQVS